MEECHYCGHSYHPMPIYQKGNNTKDRIHVCHVRTIHEGEDGEIQLDQSRIVCAERARSDGYKHLAALILAG